MTKVLINDITLRDGEQAAGVNFFPDEKLRIAEQLVEMNVPIIEAGFPVSSDNDVKGVRLVAKEFGNHVVVSAMCRANKRDIEIAAEALNGAKKGRIQVVMGTSDIHLKHKFSMSREQAKDLSVEMVEYAKTFSDDVEFAAEDATRSDWEYLIKVFVECANAGASTVEVPDTVGYTVPQEYFSLVQKIVTALPDNVVVATHCHNDLGLAVANTLSGALAGARQLEVTVNGIGERAGNASSEEVIMALNTRKDLYKIELCDINTKQIVKTSKLVENLARIPVAVTKPIVGHNAFLHESGIHQDGMIKSPQTYQLLEPTDIGLDGYHFKIGKLSGKNALKERIQVLGININKKETMAFGQFFKKYAAKMKTITDSDILTLFEKFKKYAVVE